MKTVTKTIGQLLKKDNSPLSIDVIPNKMGINLCSVKSLSWTRLKDGQLKKLTINFIPSNIYTKQKIVRVVK